MYERLTRHIAVLEKDSIGTWIIDRDNDGSPEHPIHLPFVSYTSEIKDFMKDIQCFVDEHEELNLTQYRRIIEEKRLEWNSESMKSADISDLDAVTVLALLVGAYRADRFSEGAFMSFCESGEIIRWLKRLEEIDQLM